MNEWINSFKNQLMQTAIQKEVADKDKADAIAGRHAIKMLEEIIRIMDDQMQTDDDKYNAIMKVLNFSAVPPHI